MTTTCPNGHDSDWPDWCSVCGERLGGDAAATPVAANSASAEEAAQASPQRSAPAEAAATPSGPSCSNCGVARNEYDVFCESCGYDFASGSLPEGAEQTADEAASGAAGPPMHAKVSVDPEFFAASVGDVDLALPDPVPQAAIVPLPGIRTLIGRKSTSRGIFPEIDVLALTADPAVSSRHAMLERASDGSWTLTDLGSTNGSFLTHGADEPIESGVAIAVADGTSFFIGAWTRIDLTATTA